MNAAFLVVRCVLMLNQFIWSSQWRRYVKFERKMYKRTLRSKIKLSKLRKDYVNITFVTKSTRIATGLFVFAGLANLISRFSRIEKRN